MTKELTKHSCGHTVRDDWQGRSVFAVNIMCVLCYNSMRQKTIEAIESLRRNKHKEK